MPLVVLFPACYLLLFNTSYHPFVSMYKLDLLIHAIKPDFLIEEIFKKPLNEVSFQAHQKSNEGVVKQYFK